MSKVLRAVFVMALLTQASLAGCIVKVRDVEVQSHALPLAPIELTSPVRAHLLDGSTILYSEGVDVTETTLEGAGSRFSLTLEPRGTVTSVTLDSVAALESVREGTNEAASIAASLLGTAAGVAASAGLAVAIFGSCPTIYADSAGTAVLQAESFSYSIAPLFEGRDVDAVYGSVDADGYVWLEVRNEALETHYINHMELLAVQHPRSERLLPDVHGSPLLVGATIAARTATDASGRDVRAALFAADSLEYATADAQIARRSETGYTDHVDLTFDVPARSDSVAVLLHVRNSLFNTILFYDVMLGAAGAHAVNWLGGTLEQIGGATQLGQWYTSRMGVRVYVWNGDSYQQVERVPDVGPIATKAVALMIPASGPELRVRLEFLADSWRIEHAAIATTARRPEPRTLVAARLEHVRVPDDSALVAWLREPDHEYFITHPGTSVRIGFQNSDARPAGDTRPPDDARSAARAAAGARDAAPTDLVTSYLLAAQGYYTEWVRGDWIREARTERRAQQFTADDAALEATYARWLSVRDEFEADFFARRVPVRQP